MKCPKCGNEEEFVIAIRQPEVPEVRIQIRKVGENKYEIQGAIHGWQKERATAQCIKCGCAFDPDDRVEIVGIEKLTGVLDV